MDYVLLLLLLYMQVKVWESTQFWQATEIVFCVFILANLPCTTAVNLASCGLYNHTCYSLLQCSTKAFSTLLHIFNSFSICRQEYLIILKWNSFFFWLSLYPPWDTWHKYTVITSEGKPGLVKKLLRFYLKRTLRSKKKDTGFSYEYLENTAILQQT